MAAASLFRQIMWVIFYLYSIRYSSPYDGDFEIFGQGLEETKGACRYPAVLIQPAGLLGIGENCELWLVLVVGCSMRNRDGLSRSG